MLIIKVWTFTRKEKIQNLIKLNQWFFIFLIWFKINLTSLILIRNKLIAIILNSKSLKLIKLLKKFKKE